MFLTPFLILAAKYAKCSSFRNKKLAVKGAPFFTILRGNLTRLQGHKLGYE